MAALVGRGENEFFFFEKEPRVDQKGHFVKLFGKTLCSYHAFRFALMFKLHSIIEMWLTWLNVGENERNKTKQKRKERKRKETKGKESKGKETKLNKTKQIKKKLSKLNKIELN